MAAEEAWKRAGLAVDPIEGWVRRMMKNLSPNTQAILLLTAPLILGHEKASSDILTPGEYKRLAQHLVLIKRQPSDLVMADSSPILDECVQVIDANRLRRLLGRGLLLSQVLERWQTRAIWVVSRADPEYPLRLKTRLREEAPAILYGCGDVSLLDHGGLAVVGSRDVDEALLSYSASIGGLAAQSGRMIVSGGARGVDRAAMRGALEQGGKACGFLSDNLESAAMNRENRNLLLDRRLVLVSSYDPNAGFNVGNAMQRNKYIYALADAALVVNSDLKKGGTWAGALEQLERFKSVPVYLRSTGTPFPAFNALVGKGAIPWPNPQDPDSLSTIFKARLPDPDYSMQMEFHLPAAIAENSHAFEPATDEQRFTANRQRILTFLIKGKTSTEVAEALEEKQSVVKKWLDRMIADGAVEKTTRPVRYVLRNPDLFSQD